MSTQTIKLTDAALTRVGYVDATVPPEVGGLTARDIERVPWRAPLWADGDQLHVVSLPGLPTSPVGVSHSIRCKRPTRCVATVSTRVQPVG